MPPSAPWLRFQPPPDRTQHADFPHYALLLTSRQGLWDLSHCGLLRMGLCHLLDRSEAVFVAIYHRATAIIGELGEVPARARKLWFQYQQLVQSVTATALVVGGIAATTACDDDTTSAHRYSGGVYLEAGSAGVASQDAATSSHKYSGGVYLDAGPAGGGGQGGAGGAEPGGAGGGGQAGASGAGQAGAGGAEQAAVPSAHRYSGGVYLDAGEP